MKYVASLLISCVMGVGMADTPPAPPKPSPESPPVNHVYLSGEMTVPPWGMAKLTAKGAEPGATAWMVDPSPVSEVDIDDTICFAGPPGTYKVVAFAIVANKPYIIKTTVVFQSPPGPIPPAPPIPPGPTPDPPVPPAPKPTGAVWVLGIYDTSKQVSLPDGQLAIYGSPTITAAVKAAGANWRRFDIMDSVPATGGGTIPLANTSWGAAAQKVGLPALVIFDSTKKILLAAPLPANEDVVLSTTKSITGGSSQ